MNININNNKNYNIHDFNWNFFKIFELERNYYFEER